MAIANVSTDRAARQTSTPPDGADRDTASVGCRVVSGTFIPVGKLGSLGSHVFFWITTWSQKPGSSQAVGLVTLWLSLETISVLCREERSQTIFLAPFPISSSLSLQRTRCGKAQLLASM